MTALQAIGTQAEGRHHGQRIANIQGLGIGLVCLPFVLRILVAARTPAHPDSAIFFRWWRALATQPWSNFYSITDADHLPGDLLGHGLLAFAVHRLTGFHGDSGPYLAIFKGLAIASDLLLVWVLYRFVSDISGRTSGLAVAALVAWCPGFTMLSGHWGQLDSLSIAMLIMSVRLLLGRRAGWGWRRVVTGSLAGTLAVLVKPQLILPVAFVVLLILVNSRRSGILRTTAARLASVGFLSAVWTELLCLPFRVSLPGLPLPGESPQWSLAERTSHAANFYHGMTYGAANVWRLIMQGWQTDDDLVSLGIIEVNARLLGHVMLLTALTLIAVTLIRRSVRTSPVLLCSWAAGMSMLAFYLFETRTHERYLAPWVVVSLILLAMRRRDKVVVAIAAVTQLVFAFTIAVPLYSPLDPSALQPLFTVASWLMVGVFAFGLLVPVRASRQGASPQGQESRRKARRRNLRF